MSNPTAFRLCASPGGSFCSFLPKPTCKDENGQLGLSAIDQIYSTLRSTGKGHLAFAAQTDRAGYVLVAWKAFQPVCLEILSQENMEDIWIFGFMMIGFLLIGIGNYWVYRKMKQENCTTLSKLEAALEAIGRLKEQSFKI